MLKKLRFNKYSFAIAMLYISLFITCKDDPDYIIKITSQRNQLAEYFTNPATTPLATEDLLHFEGLKFYPISRDYCIQAKWIKADKLDTIFIEHTLNKRYSFIPWGKIAFEIKGRQVVLTAFRSTDTTRNQELFVPFRDMTCGKESYSAGRYLDIPIPSDSSIIIDFNLAYNPYCAYSSSYSCPVVPKENYIKESITAGQMNDSPHRN